MLFKSVSYKRILNIGNYESKHLEMLIEVHEEENIEEKTSLLMELVERKIREDAAQKIKLEIEELKSEIRDLKEAKKLLKDEIESDEQLILDSSISVESYISDEDEDDF